MTCKQNMSTAIHQYFDRELSYEEEMQLKHHLMDCPACQNQFQELKKVHESLSSIQEVEVPSDLKENIMSQLPKDSKPRKFTKLIRHHPFITAAAIFLVVLFTSSLTQYHNNDLLYLSQQDGVITDGNVVIIPEGETIEGDFIVRNAEVIINGYIEGNLTLINSQIINEDGIQNPLTQIYSHVSGEINEIDRYVSWIFFKLQSGYDQIKTLLSD